MQPYFFSNHFLVTYQLSQCNKEKKKEEESRKSSCFISHLLHTSLVFVSEARDICQLNIFESEFALLLYYMQFTM